MLPSVTRACVPEPRWAEVIVRHRLPLAARWREAGQGHFRGSFPISEQNFSTVPSSTLKDHKPNEPKT